MRALFKSLVRLDRLQCEDGDHIVACVNACEGISPEVVPDLLATARELVRDVHGCELDASMSAAVSACAAAIARAEGGAA